MNKVRYFASRRDLIFAGLYLVLAVFAANCYGWYGINLGLGIAAAALLLTTAVYLWPHRRRTGLYGVACWLGALACAVSFCCSADSLVKTLTLGLAVVLATAAVTDQQALWLRGKGSFRLIADLCKWGIGYPLGRCGDMLWALFHKQGPDGNISGRRTGSVLLGLLCALPVLVILIPLLIRSDAAFAGLLKRVDLDTVLELVGSLLLGAGLFLILFSQGFLLPKYLRQEQPVRPGGKGISPTALGAFLAAICAVYVLYLVSQLAYFFSGFAGILPEGYTVAQYARRGFFEMTAVCAINLLLLFVCVLIVRKPQDREPLIVRILGLFISLFSLVLIATALSKMVLYINRYGMTRLRILTSVFMAFLAVCFVCVILRLLLRRFGYMQPVLAAGAVLLILLSFGNCNRFVADYNYTAWQSGQLEALDVDHLGSLGEAAVPVLWEIAQNAQPSQANEARAYLTALGTDLLRLQWLEDADLTQAQPTAQLRPADLRSYNRDTAQAAELLCEHWPEIYLAEYWRYLDP